MQSYTMRRYTLVAPHVTNDGSPSGYPQVIRRALLAAGIDGWTEYETVGSWRGKREPGTTFEVYRQFDENGNTWLDDGPYSPESFAVNALGAIGRTYMLGQEAVQVTMDGATTTVWEA